MLGAADDFMRCFSTCFALLGLKLLFGHKQVTMGSVVLLGCISGAVASAWSGGGGAWVEVNVASFLNQTLRPSMFGYGRGEVAEGMLRSLMCQMGAIPKGPEGDCTVEEEPVFAESS